MITDQILVLAILDGAILLFVSEKLRADVVAAAFRSGTGASELSSTTGISTSRPAAVGRLPTAIMIARAASTITINARICCNLIFRSLRNGRYRLVITLLPYRYHPAIGV